MDGNFFIYFLLLLLLALIQASLSIWISNVDKEEFSKRIKSWLYSASDEFFVIFLVFMINKVLNFVMTMFAFYMLEKMSKADWSIQRKDSKEAKQTTQMDREVAAEFFDYMMVDTDFRFRDFLHNIPRGTTSTALVDRSSFLSASICSSIIEQDSNILELIPGDSLCPWKKTSLSFIDIQALFRLDQSSHSNY